MVVKAELDKIGVHYGEVELGEVQIENPITAEQHNQLNAALLKSGLELAEDHKTIIVEKIKVTIIEMVHETEQLPKTKNSCYISNKLHYDYTYLANVFSKVTGVTIEKFIIAHRIERAKELLLYNELNLKQISYKLNYSSIAHLSSQFKKVTGLTPTLFKQLG